MLAFNHVGLFVSNIEESTRFYTELLGFQPAPERPTYLRLGDYYIEMCVRPETIRPSKPPILGPGAGVRHMAFKTDDLDGLASRLQAAGVEFRLPPMKANSGIGRLMFFYDPDYVDIEVVQRDTDY